MKNQTALLFATAAMGGLLAATSPASAAATVSATPMGTQVSVSHSNEVSQSSLNAKPGTLAATDKDTKGKHDCKGKNDCKGQGGCKSGDNGCQGKNSCKGKGGCNTKTSNTSKTSKAS